MTAAGIATIPERENELQNTLDSICPQVDVVFVYSQRSIRTHHPNVLHVQPPPNKYLGDAGKFIALINELTEAEYFFTCDDDLIYPPDYISTLTQKINEYGQIITCHGRTFPHAPINSYYRDYAQKFRCMDEVPCDTYVQFGGTGCMGFKTEQFRPQHFPTANMADIHLAIEAKKQNKKIICISHKAGWIQYQQVSNTIYERFKFDDSIQTQFVNEYLG